ncbi:YcxB family protein [Saccharopolyspora hirsuta]|uniref:YcxB family protein n=1 Tax=Saccharopolyspora hirsuta TaxID=1837 RepID=A0A5M7BAE8_SACHI|nr:YcxB family protein [Saccharopolyspora hirsuta]KAA5826543.1 YcxB family protein [Saccharopolyspora hirsuta]
MQISISVPYDEQRLRRTLRFLANRQMKPYRILGVAFVVLGAALIALDLTSPAGYGITAGGLALLFAVVPITVASGMRMQSAAVKQGYHLSLTDEWAQVSYPLVESRFRWQGLDRVVETPEVWYAMFGKAQALTIPKDLMAPEQQAQFSAFTANLPR